MVCDVIENCRCYAYKGELKQFCGVRKGRKVLPCPIDCCSGGCPDDGSREPFRYINRPTFVNLDNRGFIFLLWLIVTAITIYMFRNLKIKQLR